MTLLWAQKSFSHFLSERARVNEWNWSESFKCKSRMMMKGCASSFFWPPLLHRVIPCQAWHSQVWAYSQPPVSSGGGQRTAREELPPWGGPVGRGVGEHTAHPLTLTTQKGELTWPFYFIFLSIFFLSLSCILLILWFAKKNCSRTYICVAFFNNIKNIFNYGNILWKHENPHTNAKTLAEFMKRTVVSLWYASEWRFFFFDTLLPSYLS